MMQVEMKYFSVSLDHYLNINICACIIFGEVAVGFLLEMPVEPWFISARQL